LRVPSFLCVAGTIKNIHALHTSGVGNDRRVVPQTAENRKDIVGDDLSKTGTLLSCGHFP